MTLILWFGALVGCASPPVGIDRSEPLTRPAPEWPEASSELTVLPLRAPRNLRDGHVYLVAGHANGPERDGNTGVHGQIEADVALGTTRFVEDWWSELEPGPAPFDWTLGRRAGDRPTYGDRLRRAEEVGADVFIDIHTDARGPWTPWATNPKGEIVYRCDEGPGFAVLYNEGGTLGPERRELAQLVADRLAAAGFPAYDGADYTGLYDLDPTPGVFIDRRGLMMLRRPAMPSIIIETHNAKDYEESLRWREARTHEAFAAALTDALTLWFTEP